MSFDLDRRRFLLLAGTAALMPRAALARPLLPPSPFPAPAREAMVPVEGGRIYVRVNGNLSGPRPPLLLIHGGPGGTHADFVPATALAADRAIILYDQLDSGRSDAPNDPNNWIVPRFVDEIDAIRRYLKIERLHVLGASWGGTVALEYGARRPRGLASLILQSPLITTKSWLADAGILRGQLPADVQAQLTACEARTPPPAPVCDAATGVFYKNFNRRVLPTPDLAAYRKGLPRGLNRAIYEGMWGDSEFVSTGTLRAYNGEPLLKRLDGARTLFMAGEFDEARPATVAAFAKEVPNSTFIVVKGASHGILNDQPAKFLAIVDKWMRDHDG